MLQCPTCGQVPSTNVVSTADCAIWICPSPCGRTCLSVYLGEIDSIRVGMDDCGLPPSQDEFHFMAQGHYILNSRRIQLSDFVQRFSDGLDAASVHLVLGS
jgi:hypothetical protein